MHTRCMIIQMLHHGYWTMSHEKYDA
jgi:hypothetical protein